MTPRDTGRSLAYSVRIANRRLSLKAYLVGLSIVFLVVASLGIAYQRRTTFRDARQSARQDADFAARIAARDIGDALELAKNTVASTAALPTIADAFAAPAGCTLSFGAPGEFGGGHLDIIAADGTVACSSLPAEQSYANAAWLKVAVARPELVGPIVDNRTGQKVIATSAPIPGYGAVVAFLNLATLGPGLERSLGGPRHLEFVLTSEDRGTVLARSIAPERWVGASAVGTSFADAAGHLERPDLDGTRRFYGEASVSNQGWSIFAGANRSQALAAANRLVERQLAIFLAGLLVFLAAALVMYRGIARPLRELRDRVRAATRHETAGPISVVGPVEVSALVEDFNALLGVTERELESSAQLVAMVESAPDAIIGAGLDGAVTSWNRAAERLYGYTAEEVIGDLFPMIPPDRETELHGLFAQSLRGHAVEPYEMPLMCKDGRLVDVSFTIAPVRAPSGKIIGISTVTRDVSARNAAEAKARELEREVHQLARMESLGQLACGIAHDFNNLLGIIATYAEFVREQTSDNEAVRGDVEQICAASARAAALTRQLLVFGRQEPTSVQLLDLGEVVHDIAHMMARGMGRRIKVAVACEPDIPAIEADRGRIEQVLVNLIVNARDAMPDGGTLSIGTSRVTLNGEHRRLCPELDAGSYVELTVRDTGIGMSPEVAARIFEPFFTTKPKDEGTGLGMATVYGIATGAGGGVNVESELGVGTTFRVLFPAVESAAVSSAPPPIVSADQGEGQTILVVDDEPAILEATARMLSRNGYQVLRASNYADALALAVENPFDLLVTDSVMPDMAGGDLAVRVDEVRPGRPVLFVSGASDDGSHPHDPSGAGASWLHKPYSEAALLEQVRTLLASIRS